MTAGVMIVLMLGAMRGLMWVLRSVLGVMCVDGLVLLGKMWRGERAFGGLRVVRLVGRRARAGQIQTCSRKAA
jgi:hypothetical protein